MLTPFQDLLGEGEVSLYFNEAIKAMQIVFAFFSASTFFQLSLVPQNTGETKEREKETAAEKQKMKMKRKKKRAKMHQVG